MDAFLDTIRAEIERLCDERNGEVVRRVIEGKFAPPDCPFMRMLHGAMNLDVAVNRWRDKLVHDQQWGLRMSELSWRQAWAWHTFRRSSEIPCKVCGKCLEWRGNIDKLHTYVDDFVDAMIDNFRRNKSQFPEEARAWENVINGRVPPSPDRDDDEESEWSGAGAGVQDAGLVLS